MFVIVNFHLISGKRFDQCTLSKLDQRMFVKSSFNLLTQLLQSFCVIHIQLSGFLLMNLAAHFLSGLRRLHHFFRAKPALSVVVVVHNMQREIVRTLYTLDPSYQRDVKRSDYEVILVDNCSDAPVDQQVLDSCFSGQLQVKKFASQDSHLKQKLTILENLQQLISVKIYQKKALF